MTPTIINHPSQLNALSILPLFRPVRRAPIHLAGAMEKHPQREAWERDINSHLRACGCSSAANGLLLGLIVAGLVIAWQVMATDDSMTPLRAIGLFFTLAIGGAVVGKLTGLASADRKLKMLVTVIQGHWKVDTPPGDGAISCG
jgi:hypothetical protein